MKPNFTDKDRLTDVLNAQKQAAGLYNTAACEAATPALRTCMMDILTDEHRIQEEVFTEMNSRGWYPVEQAEDQKLTQAKTRFASC